MCVEPFIDWENGDVTLFLALFPVMCAYVASSHKTKIPKVFLMLFERLRQLKEKHPNAVKLFAANCSLFDEEKVELLDGLGLQERGLDRVAGASGSPFLVESERFDLWPLRPCEGEVRVSPPSSRRRRRRRVPRLRPLSSKLRLSKSAISISGISRSISFVIAATKSVSSNVKSMIENYE